MVSEAVFYILIFGVLAVVLVVGGITAASARRRRYESDVVSTSHPGKATVHHGGTAAQHDAGRKSRKAKRAQSKHDRRKHH